MTLGFVGLGKMGFAMAHRLKEKGHQVVVYDELSGRVKEAQERGLSGVQSLKELISGLHVPRVIWMMVPHQATDAVIRELAPELSRGDIIIDGGNSYFRDSIRRAKMLSHKGIYLLDVGISGGPGGVDVGLCIMAGGDEEMFKQNEPLFKDLAKKDGYRYVGHSGAGHFVKMVHNGIEYGMMQSLAEGFSLLHQAEFNLHLKEIAELFNNGSVIESRLLSWLRDAYEKFGPEFSEVSGSVGATGEGAWTVATAQEFQVSVPVIEAAARFRAQSKEKPSYTGRILSALRHMFGGHAISLKTKK